MQKTRFLKLTIEVRGPYYLGHHHIKKCEVEPVTWVWEQEPLGVQHRTSGQGAKFPDAENLSAFGCLSEAANLPHSSYFCKLVSQASKHD